MLSRLTRAFVLLAVAALLANAQCYGACAAVSCGSDQTPSGRCHHNKSSHQSNAACVHQHAEFTGPEVGIAKAGVATAAPVLAALIAEARVAVPDRLHVPRADSGSPPGVRIFSAISVLRI